MVEIKLLGRVKYENTIYSANDVISVDKATAEYLQERKLCKVMAVVEPAKEVVKDTAEKVEEKPVKKNKKAKQESK